ELGAAGLVGAGGAAAPGGVPGRVLACRRRGGLRRARPARQRGRRYRRQAGRQVAGLRGAHGGARAAVVAGDRGAWAAAASRARRRAPLSPTGDGARLRRRAARRGGGSRPGGASARDLVRGPGGGGRAGAARAGPARLVRTCQRGPRQPAGGGAVAPRPWRGRASGTADRDPGLVSAAGRSWRGGGSLLG